MIEIDNITVEYKSAGRTTKALDSFSLDIAPGEYLAVLGPNGCGKSTLLRAICGLVRLSGGRIVIDGKEVAFGRFGRDLFGKVGVVFQEPSGQFLMRDVKTEIGSVLENLGLSPADQKARFTELVGKFDLGDILDMPPDKLSGGQMQIANLACALASGPEILLLDEPTTFLDSRYRRVLLDYIDSFIASGGTAIHVTQYPDEAQRAVRVCVVESGKPVFSGSPADVFGNSDLLSKNALTRPRATVFARCFGFNLDDKTAIDSLCSRVSLSPADRKSASAPPSGEIAVKASGLNYRYPESGFELDIDSLSLRKGEVTGLLGPTGSGKSTLALLLSGLQTPASGDIAIFGKPVSSYSEKVLRARVGISWQLPDLTLIGPTAAEDIRFGPENLGMAECDVKSLLGLVGLAGFKERIVDTLSGGEKRKLALAGLLACGPDYLVLDEPEAFLDPRSQGELARIIGELKAAGKGLLVIAHDLPFLSEIAYRIVCLDKGRIACDVPAADFFSDTSYLERLGLEVDPMIEFRAALRERGIILPFASLDPEKIASYLM